MKKFKILSIITIVLLIMAYMPTTFATDITRLKIDLTNLTSNEYHEGTAITRYTQDDFEKFISDYNSGSLPAVYITEFLYDGVGMVKTYDLDDYIEAGNDIAVETLSLTVINVNTMSDVEFTGELTGGMIAVNTNGKTGEINLILNGVKIDTDSKKAPAIYVYNKDVNYTGCKVTITTVEGSKNYIEGGKFKKVSLVGSNELSNYTSKYTGDYKTYYETYTKYYGVYNSEQINNILFAKVTASNDDLADGDPYYFYKGAGAISSDIDLNFEGTGYLEVKSKNKEGIETKGNLTFSGGTGDYAIYAEDDCLNTTTKSTSGTNVRNALSINVNSLIAIVDSGEDSDEGDAIDSNGTLEINGGLIIAVAHPGQDAGIDSEKGTTINGGIVLATGDMTDEISSNSKQNFSVFNFGTKVQADTLITLLNESGEIVMAYKTDRTFSNLLYSSPNLKEGTYTLYKDGTIQGTDINGFYTNITSYTKGTQLGYSSTGSQGGMGGGMQQGMQQQGNMFSNTTNNQNVNQTMPTPPDGGNMTMNNDNMPMNGGNMKNNNDNRPQMPGNGNNNQTMQEPPSGEMPISGNMPNGGMTNIQATNKEFKINGISNVFSGVAEYTESTSTNNGENSSNVDNTTSSSILPQTGITLVSVGIAIAVFAVVIGFGIYSYKKQKNVK